MFFRNKLEHSGERKMYRCLHPVARNNKGIEILAMKFRSGQAFQYNSPVHENNIMFNFQTSYQ